MRGNFWRHPLQPNEVPGEGNAVFGYPIGLHKRRAEESKAGAYALKG